MRRCAVPHKKIVCCMSVFYLYFICSEFKSVDMGFNKKLDISELSFNKYFRVLIMQSQ